MVLAEANPASLLLRNGRPLHYRVSPIPDGSALMRVPLTEGTAAAVVVSEVAAVQVIDIHTHLLPPSHGSICLWGIDELLTYVRGARLRMGSFCFCISPLTPVYFVSTIWSRSTL
jgi:hypothetical protein